MKEKVTEIFCIVDDFCNTVDENFAEKLLPSGKKPTRTPEITHSEIFTIILLYQVRQFKNFLCALFEIIIRISVSKIAIL